MNKERAKEMAKEMEVMYKAFLAREKENDKIYKAYVINSMKTTKFTE